MNIVLPVESQSGGQKKVSPQLILVLEEPAKKLFPKYNPSVAALSKEGEWPFLHIIVEGGEGESTGGIRIVVQAAPA